MHTYIWRNVIVYVTFRHKSLIYLLFYFMLGSVHTSTLLIHLHDFDFVKSNHFHQNQNGKEKRLLNITLFGYLMGQLLPFARTPNGKASTWNSGRSERSTTCLTCANFSTLWTRIWMLLVKILCSTFVAILKRINATGPFVYWISYICLFVRSMSPFPVQC